MRPLSTDWQPVERRPATQDGAHRSHEERRQERVDQGEPCEHSWSLVLVQETWSGPMHHSSCTRCRAVLSEWVSRSRDSTQR